MYIIVGGKPERVERVTAPCCHGAITVFVPRTLEQKIKTQSFFRGVVTIYARTPVRTFKNLKLKNIYFSFVCL